MQRYRHAFTAPVPVRRSPYARRLHLRFRAVVACDAAPPTPLTLLVFRGRRVFIKRDDVLKRDGMTGSKARKFAALAAPDALNDVACVASYGGAQSNAMVALANLCDRREVPFVYFTRPVAPGIHDMDGNFRNALCAHMQHFELDGIAFHETFMSKAPFHAQDAVRDAIYGMGLSHEEGKRILYVPQGGAWPGAEPGVKKLAHEIRAQIAELRSQGLLKREKRPVLFLAAGTGATALFLSRHLSDTAKVVAVPVSGDERYLVKQMRWLDFYKKPAADSMVSSVFPDVLRPRLRASFADVRPDKMRIWKEMQRAAADAGEFDFDLTYAPKAWEEAMLAIEEGRLCAEGEDLIYYHSGGLEGNGSMLGMLHLCPRLSIMFIPCSRFKCIC